MTAMSRVLPPMLAALQLHGAGSEPVAAAAVVFDLDGVLVDSEPAWVEVERLAVEELGGRWDPTRTDDLAGSAAAVANRLLAERCGLVGREEELDAVIHRLGPRVFAEWVVAMPGALEAVRAVAGLVPVAIATNAPRAIAEVSVAAAGLDELIQVLVSVSDVRAGKPAPDVYLAAAAALEVPAAACLAVDDTHTGLSAAVAAGMRTVAFGRPGRVPEGVVGVVAGWSQVAFTELR